MGKNTERDLERALEKGFPGLDIDTHLHKYEVGNVPVMDTESAGIKMTSLNIFLPHEILHAIYESDVVSCA